MSLGYIGVFGDSLGSLGVPWVSIGHGVTGFLESLGSWGRGGLQESLGFLKSLDPWSLGTAGVHGLAEAPSVQVQHILNHKSQHKIPSVTWRRVLRTPLPLPEGAPQVDDYKINRGGFGEHLIDTGDILEGSLMSPDHQYQIS